MDSPFRLVLLYSGTPLRNAAATALDASIRSSSAYSAYIDRFMCGGGTGGVLLNSGYNHFVCMKNNNTRPTKSSSDFANAAFGNVNVVSK